MNAMSRFFSSLRLTVVLLAFSLALVFFGTLDQVQWGIQHTQALYFESWVVWSPVISLVKVFAVHRYDPEWAHFKIPLPGGFTLGALLLVNLLCAHFRYFKASWSKTGITVLHAGVLLLIVSGFQTAMQQREWMMRLDEGGASVRYATSTRAVELVLIDHSAPDADTVVSVPLALLERGESLALPNGFTLAPKLVLPNAGVGLRANLLQQYEGFAAQSQMAGAPAMSEAQFRQVNQSIASLRDPAVVAIAVDGAPLLASEGLDLRGFAARMDGVAQAQPQTYAEDEANMPAAVVAVVAPTGERLGAWLLSAGFGPAIPAQGFDFEGRRYDLALRFAREYFPFALQLRDFTHDVYPGTDIPRNFASDVVIDDPDAGIARPALIYMNHPLRYGGYTFYQASFDNGDTTSILQVVRNPGWLLPYAAVALVGLGMTLQFGLSLGKFARRQRLSTHA